MANHTSLASLFSDIADAIRAKTGGSSNIIADNFPTAISQIPTGGTPTLQTKTKTYTPTTSQQTEQVRADNGYDGLEQVNVTVNAMPTGSAGTPTASKGTVSDHSVTVTPSVTNTTGYINGGTKTGTGVSVSASELVSGTKSITQNGTGIDVANYASVDVNVSGGGGASLGTKTITANGTYDAEDDGYDGYSSVNVNVSGGGGGLEYETGTYTPSADIARPTINFTNTHTKMPLCVFMADSGNPASNSQNSNVLFLYVDYAQLLGPVYNQQGAGIHFGNVVHGYLNSGLTVTSARVDLKNSSDNSGSSSTNYPRYWVTEQGFRPYTASTSRYWRAGRTYKWVAVWAPTT